MDVTFRKRAECVDDLAQITAEVEAAFKLPELALEGKLSPPASWPDDVLRSVILAGEYEILLFTYRQLVELAPMLDSGEQDGLMNIARGLSGMLVSIARRADPDGVGREPLPE
jgi:hypothetical protein